MPYIYKFQMFTRLQKPTFYLEKTKNSTRIHVLIAVYSLLVCHYKCFDLITLFYRKFEIYAVYSQVLRIIFQNNDHLACFHFTAFKIKFT